MHIKLTQPLALILIALPIASSVLAAEPEGIRSGSAIYFPHAKVAVGHDDNVLSQETNPISSTVIYTDAGIQAQVLQDNQKGAFEFGVAAQIGSYQDSSADDYQDGSVNAGYIFQPNDKMKVSGKLSLDQLHEARRPATLATSTEPDVYQNSNLDGEFYYGINDMDGADTLISLGITDRTYKTNLGANLSKERQQSEVSGMLRFPVAPNTRLRVSVGFTDFDYDTANNLDSIENRNLLGVEWQASDQTLISLDIGLQTKKFDQNSNADDELEVWEASIAWSPEKFNRFELTASKDFDESATTANYLSKKTVDLSWSYDWEDYFSTVLAIGSSDDKSFNTGSTTVDTNSYVSFSADYELMPTLSVTAALSKVEVDSQVVGGSSDKNLITMGIAAAF
jgi:hypothetical protein